MVEKPEASTPGGGSGETHRPGRNWAVAGIVSGVLSLVILPVFLGPLGILFGFIGYVRGARRLGKVAVGVSIFSLVLGSILYVLLRNLMGAG